MARILGRSALNFPNSDAAEIHGPRSEDADKAVAAVIDHARTFVAANGKVSRTSVYIGVSKNNSSHRNPWQSQIQVSPKPGGGGIGAAHTHTHTHTHARTHTHSYTLAQFNRKNYFLGFYAVEADAAAARDVVAKVLGSPLNFKKPRKITGQRSKGADPAVADAVKAANAFVLGNSTLWCFLTKKSSKFLTVTPTLSLDDPSRRQIPFC